MKIIIIGLVFLFSLSATPEAVFAQYYMPLWPEGKMPDSRGMKLERIGDPERVTQIDVPGMYPFFTSLSENKGAAVLIFPPGGYEKLVYNIAGMQLAKWFNTFGVNAFVVMYRLPISPDLENPAFGPLMDAQRALKIVRAHAAEWGIDPERIGVMGCSAGGGIAANVSTISKDFSAIGDSLDHMPFTPDFQILVSGTVSMSRDAHRGSHDALLGKDASPDLEALFSGELNVTDETPPAFITCASDDPVVDPNNSVRYYAALKEHGVEACLHVFTHGEHSIALRNNPLSTNLWVDLCEAWMEEMGLLNQ